MTNQLDFSPEELAGMFAVLQHPDHQQGLENRYLTVTKIDDRARCLVRLSATISGNDSLEEWDLPNPTIRMTMPEPPEEFSSIPGAPQTTSRVYTLADIDTENRTVQIDLVRHGENSPVMRWLKTLLVGDRVEVVGPRPHRTPADGNPRVLLADSSALPAATRILTTMPPQAQTIVIAAVPEDEFSLLRQQDDLSWDTITAYRVDPHKQDPLASALTELDLPSTASVWAAGERDDMRIIRHHCKYELGLSSDRIQVFGYWKRGVTNTRMDVARLRATHKILATGGTMDDVDDFEIDL